jgi:hypothetical protein
MQRNGFKIKYFYGVRIGAHRRHFERGLEPTPSFSLRLDIGLPERGEHHIERELEPESTTRTRTRNKKAGTLHGEKLSPVMVFTLSQ